jgi:hypothetical protein
MKRLRLQPSFLSARAAAITAFGACFFPTLGVAQVNATWNGGSGNWDTATNWSCQISTKTPGPCVPNGGQFGIDLAGGSVTVTTPIFVDSVLGRGGSIAVNSSSLIVASVIADLGSATLDKGHIDALDLQVYHSLKMDNSDIIATASVSEGTVYISNNSYVQQLSVSGALTLTNSKLGQNSTSILLGPNASSITNSTAGGFLLVDQGAALTIDQMSKFNISGATASGVIGFGGKGTLTLQGGSTLTSTDLMLGTGAHSNGEVNVTGDSTLIKASENEIVGGAGAGTFTQTAGSNIVGSTLTLANGSGVFGTYKLGGTGSLTGPGGPVSSEIVGNSGNGLFLQTGGKNEVNNLTLGLNAGSFGQYTQSGGEAIVSNLVLGKNGRGVYKLSGSIDDLNASSETVEAGTFIQSGATNTTKTLIVAAKLGSSASYGLEDGLLEAGSENVVGNQGFTGFGQSGGINHVGTLTLSTSNRPNNGGYGISGGRLTSTTIIVEDGAKLTVNSNGMLTTTFLDVQKGGEVYLQGPSISLKVTGSTTNYGEIIGVDVNPSLIDDFGTIHGNRPILNKPPPDSLMGLTALSNGYIQASAGSQFEIGQGATVPEPSTWVMMLLGFAGLGFVGYRQTRRAKPQATEV